MDITNATTKTASQIPDALVQSQPDTKEIKDAEKNGKRDVKIASFVVLEDGTVDSPYLQGIMNQTVEAKTLLYLRCLRLTEEARRKLPADPDLISNLEKKVSDASEALSGVNVVKPADVASLTNDDKADIRSRRAEKQRYLEQLAYAKAELAEKTAGIEDALKTIRQIESETILEACRVETHSHARMNAYITAASRKAGESFSIIETRSELFSQIAEELYAYLYGDEKSRARALYSSPQSYANKVPEYVADTNAYINDAS